MRIRVISVGKTNIPFVKQGVDEYLKRLSKYAKVAWDELPDIKNGGRMDVATLKEKEGELILSKVAKGSHLVLLDEGGKQFSSVAFAQWLGKLSTHLAGELCFVIGGAYGFSDVIYKAAAHKIALSEMTFSHQIVRAIFMEQIYRAFTIQRGEPYHHA